MLTPFFLDELPSDAEYWPRGLFFSHFVPGKENEFLPRLQVLDTRVTKQDLVRWALEPAPSHLSECFAVKDIQESSRQGEMLCSLCIFKMEVDELHTGKVFQIYLDGLKYWIEIFQNDRREQKLRVYVGDSVWEILYKEGILDANHVDFVRMAQSSKRTEVGVLWRFLAFDDMDYEYAYIEETDGVGQFVGEEWELSPYKDFNKEIAASRFCGNPDFSTKMSFLPPGEKRDNSFPQDDCPLFFWVDDYRLSDPLFIHRLSEYVQFMSPTLIRGPNPLPFKMARMMAAHFDRGTNRIIYHEDINAWTNVRERHMNLNFRYIDDHWLFHLTKVIDVNFYGVGAEMLLCDPFLKKYGETWFEKRIYDNLIADGNRLLMLENEEYGSPFDFSEHFWEQIRSYDYSVGDSEDLDYRLLRFVEEG